MKRVKGTALVTGGAMRIGRALCLYLAEQGYQIALHYGQSRNAAKVTARAISRRNQSCTIFQCDLENESEVLSLINRVKKTFPDLNLLINNAAIFYPSKLSQCDVVSFNRHLTINCKAPYMLTAQFARLCKQGQVINILDTRITAMDIGHFEYTLSKKALADVTELSAVALAPKIRVNAIAPGIILPPVGQGNTYLEKLAKRLPLKRKGTLKHIQQAVQFFLDNTEVTGQVIFVDGGRHLI
jgi:pteridine reductase